MSRRSGGIRNEDVPLIAKRPTRLKQTGNVENANKYRDRTPIFIDRVARLNSFGLSELKSWRWRTGEAFKSPPEATSLAWAAVERWQRCRPTLGIGAALGHVALWRHSAPGVTSLTYLNVDLDWRQRGRGVGDVDPNPPWYPFPELRHGSENRGRQFPEGPRGAHWAPD